jgi:uncharacterized protein (UPF0335 family)
MLRDDIRQAADRLERLLDERDERTEDIKDLKLELKCKDLPVKAIEELVQARRKDKLGKKRDHITDLLTIAPALGIDLGIVPEGGDKNASSGTAQNAARDAA